MRYDKVNKKYNKIIEEKEALQSKYDELDNSFSKTKAVLESTMHEVRRFSGELSHHAEELSKNSTYNSSYISDLAETIFYTSGLLTARLGFTDIELNPTSITKQTPLRTGVYKKFEKSSRVLKKQAKAKNIDISFQGNSYLNIDAIQAFELVPFVILDNAIKYSPSDQKINVSFDEDDSYELKVIISNIGPTINQNELLNLFERGLRGLNAENSKISGEGLGLYLAKSLCDLNNIDINISSNSETIFSLDNIPYSEFNLTLKFRKLLRH